MSFDYSTHDISPRGSKVTTRRRRRFRTTNHHESYCKPPVPRPPLERRSKGTGFQMRAMGKWIKQKKRHKDVMNKESGDVVLFTQHNYNFYTHCGFLGIMYNPHKPSLRFVSLVQDKFKEFELAWKFEDALAARAMGDIAHWPVLSNITNEMASRLMVAGEKGLIMFLPEKPETEKKKQDANDYDDFVWPPRTPLPPKPPVSPSTAMKQAHFTPIYTGHRANEKNFDIIFKVHEANLDGSIGRTLRFVVDKRPKKVTGSLEVNVEVERKKLRLCFYYSTSLLQHILVSMERVGKPELKKDLARNLCKYLVINEEGTMSKGFAELKFDISRISENHVMLDGAPGAGQAALTKRLLSSAALLPSPRPIGKIVLLPADQNNEGIKRPQWRGTHLKDLTVSENNQTPNGQATSDLLYRDCKRAITPDSVVLHRRLGMAGTYQVPGILGGNRMRMYNSAADRWRNKAMLPNERIAQLPPIQISRNKVRNYKFYQGQRAYQRRRTSHKSLLDHTMASKSGMWENRDSPREIDDLLISHDHPTLNSLNSYGRPNAGGSISQWNKKDISTVKFQPRSGFGSPRSSTVRRPTYKQSMKGDDTRPAVEVQYNDNDSVRAAKSIVRERATKDGLFGNQIQVGFNIL